MKLYYSPGACSLSPHIALQEAGVPYETVLASTSTHKLPDGTDFHTINALGYVPVLELDDGTRMTEGPALVQYIADQVPDRHLLAPVGSIARYQTLEWLNYVATELHKGFTPLFRPDTPEDYKPVARALLEKKLQYVDASLADKQWLTGHRFTIADGYLFTVLRWGYAIKLDMAACGHIGSWMAQVAARPAVADALAAEGLK